jgi:hypothetical protein
MRKRFHHLLSICRNDFIAHWAQLAFKFGQVLHGHPNASTQKRFHCLLSIRAIGLIACWAKAWIDFIAWWANGEIFLKKERWTAWWSHLRRWRLISTEGETGLRRGRLIYRGGDSSIERKIPLWRVRLFYGGEDSFLLMVEQNCWNLSVDLYLQYRYKLSVHVIFWYKNVTSCPLMVNSMP